MRRLLRDAFLPLLPALIALGVLADARLTVNLTACAVGLGLLYLNRSVWKATQ